MYCSSIKGIAGGLLLQLFAVYRPKCYARLTNASLVLVLFSLSLFLCLSLYFVVMFSMPLIRSNSNQLSRRSSICEKKEMKIILRCTSCGYS